MTPGEPEDTKGRPPIAEAALFGLCPQCGAKAVSPAKSVRAPRCPACGLELARYNVGDGPAALLILVIGALVAGLAIWLQLAVEPAFWVHVLLWVPLTTLLVIGGLRVSKAALLASEYRHKAGEARRRP